jgi:uncharacterized protein with HEPN domain
MSKRTASEWLSDIIAWGERLEDHLSGVDRDTFFRNPMLQDAASKCAEAIGEAAGKLDDLDASLNDAFPGLSLKQARRSRDRLAHGYHNVDLEILWITVSSAIPKTVTAARVAKLSYDNRNGTRLGRAVHSTFLIAAETPARSRNCPRLSA